MWARGAVVVNCVLGYVMLIGGGAAAGFSPLGVSLFWDGGLGGLSCSGCLARGDWYFLVLFSGCLGLWRGGGLVGCIQDRELGTLALPSEVYPAGNLQ